MSAMEQNEFDRALTKAMQRVDPPETLAKFLMKAAEVEAERALPRSQPSRRWAWVTPKPQRAAFGRVSVQFGAAVAAVMLVCVLVAGQVHVRHEREQAALQQQFNEGLRITDRALDQTREKLQRAGLDLGN